jgi:hypothetical protein
MDEKKMQMLPPERRNFPFAPPPVMPDNGAVDMSACFKSDASQTTTLKHQESCADALIIQLKAGGFALVRGT